MIILLALILGMNEVYGATVKADNVVISHRKEVYRFKAGKDGKLESVKVSQRETFMAINRDETALAYAFYNDGVTVDKASAPGAKAVYKPSMDDDVFYEDSRLCELKIPLKKGKSAEAVIERTVKDPAHLCEIGMMSIYPVVTYELVLEVPKELAGTLKMTHVNFPEKALIEQIPGKDGAITYRYVVEPLPAVKSERMRAPHESYRPWIYITGYFSDTNDLYRYLHAKVTPEEPSAEVTALAKEVTANATTDKEKAYAIAAWVRNNIRYVAIEHGEYGQRPETAANVLANRYGDCKGSANLIRMMLKSIGLDGRLVWIGTNSEICVDWDQVPALGSGNHMIAACMIDGSPIFLDGTISYAPAASLPYGIRGQQALIENGDECLLVRVPKVSPVSDLLTLTAEYTLREDGVLEGDVTHLYSGSRAGGIDDTYHSITASRRDKFLHMLMHGERSGVDVERLEYNRESPWSETATLSAHVLDRTSARRTGGRLLIQMPMWDGLYDPIEEEGRQSPVRLGGGVSVKATTTLHIGDELATATFTDEEVTSPWINGSVKYRVNGGTLHVDMEIHSTAEIVPLDKIGEWNDTLKRLKKMSTLLVKTK